MENLVDPQELPEESVIGGNMPAAVEVGANDIDREVGEENDRKSEKYPS